MKRIFAILTIISMLFIMVSCTSDPEPIMPNETNIESSEIAVPETTSPVVDVVLYDSNGIKIICKGYKEAGDWDLGPSLSFMIENNTNKNITVQVRDCSVNGFMIEPTCSADVAAGKKANDNMTWFSSDFEENSIETIDTIEFYFHIFDSDEWETIVDSDIISLNFN